jgi:hypothetical protein
MEQAVHLALALVKALHDALDELAIRDLIIAENRVGYQVC